MHIMMRIVNRDDYLYVGLVRMVTVELYIANVPIAY